jgi:hypothetical protein
MFIGLRNDLFKFTQYDTVLHTRCITLPYPYERVLLNVIKN